MCGGAVGYLLLCVVVQLAAYTHMKGVQLATYTHMRGVQLATYTRMKGVQLVTYTHMKGVQLAGSCILYPAARSGTSRSGGTPG